MRSAAIVVRPARLPPGPIRTAPGRARGIPAVTPPPGVRTCPPGSGPPRLPTVAIARVPGSAWSRPVPPALSRPAGAVGPKCAASRVAPRSARRTCAPLVPRGRHLPTNRALATTRPSSPAGCPTSMTRRGWAGGSKTCSATPGSASAGPAAERRSPHEGRGRAHRCPRAHGPPSDSRAHRRGHPGSVRGAPSAARALGGTCVCTSRGGRHLAEADADGVGSGPHLGAVPLSTARCQASRVIIRQAPSAVHTTIHATMTQTAQVVDSERK